MPRRSAALLAALPLAALAACQPAATTAPPAPAPAPVTRPAAAGNPGFDTNVYPGDAALRAWRAASPYEWVGYYLPAPCHRETSWAGKRSTLIELGWAMAVIYVGQQDWTQMPSRQAPQQPAATDSAAAAQQPPAQTATTPSACSAANLVGGRGATDADDAIAKAAAEGFPNGTVIYLDVERVQAVSIQLATYVREWAGRVLAEGRYLPGLYVHRVNAELAQPLQSAWLGAGRADAPPLWVTATDSAFTLDRTPAGSGVQGATVWQGRLDVTESWGGASLRIDQNVATSRSPSSPP